MVTLGLVAVPALPGTAAIAGFTSSSDDFSTTCADPLVQAATFRVNAFVGVTNDGDHDVNVGARLTPSLAGEASGPGQTWPDLVVDLDVAGSLESFGPFDHVTGTGWQTVVAGTEVEIAAADAGRVIEVRADVRNGSPDPGCSTRRDAAARLYVNRPPQVEPDQAATLQDQAVLLDPLANDHATWDSGVLTSAVPSSSELATQDDLRRVPAGQAATAITVESGPQHGSVVVQSDGRVLYTPAVGFVGRDGFTYSLTDNDGASSAGTVSIDVDPLVLTSIRVTASALEVQQGDSVTLTATGFTVSGIELGDVTDDVTFGSDVSSDVVVGNRVTFPTASPHRLTGTHDVTGATDSVTVEVVAPAGSGTTVPAPAPASTSAGPTTSVPPGVLPRTGGPAWEWILVAAAWMTAGGLLLMSRREG